MTDLEIENAIEEITKSNNVIAMQQMLASGVNINFKKGLWLYKSAYYKQNDMVIQLLQKGASVSVDGYKAFKTIIQNGDFSMFKLFVKYGAKISIQNNYPLRLAASGGHLDIVNYLLQQQDIDIHALNDYALRYASIYRYKSIVKILLHHGASMQACEYMPLHCAIHYDDVELFKLVEEKITTEELFGIYLKGKSYNSYHCVHALPCYLIDKYPELINYQQTKLLRIFSRYENIKMVQYLVEKGANIHARNNAAFTYALKNGHKDIVLYLLSLNVKIFLGTPIVTAKIRENLPCCNILKDYPNMNLEEISNKILQKISLEKNIKLRNKCVDQLNQLIYHFPYLNAKLIKNADAMLES